VCVHCFKDKTEEIMLTMSNGKRSYNTFSPNNEKRLMEEKLNRLMLLRPLRSKTKVFGLVVLY